MANNWFETKLLDFLNKDNLSIKLFSKFYEESKRLIKSNKKT
jgi:hypothetical protein